MIKLLSKGVLPSLAALLALGLLAGCGGPSEEEKAKAEAAKKAKAEALAAKAEYTLCKTQVGPLIDAEKELQSRISIGLNYRDYGTEVGDVQVAYDTVPIDQIKPACLTGVGVHAENALNQYTKAADAWDECFEDIDCSNDEVDSSLQKRWTRADELIDTASEGLDAMKQP